jgi:PEP-CTERM motif-containing protein
MKFVTAVLFGTALLSSTVAHADSFTLNGAYTTSGIFTCFHAIACTGSGTNSVTLGTGSNAATITFNGLSATEALHNYATPVTFGQFVGSGDGDFTFPTRTNKNSGILRFALTIHHTLPESHTNRPSWTFAPGGDPDLPLQLGPGHTGMRLNNPTAPPGHHYTMVVYTFSPYPLSIPGNGTTDLTAKAGLVPEPATFVLVGGGLVAAIAARRRKRTIADASADQA